MSKDKSFFDQEFEYGEGEINYEQYVNNLDTVAKNRERLGVTRAKYASSVNEVGVRPEVPEEILAERKKYKDDLKLALKELFPDSTGLKPFGKVQNASTDYVQYIMSNGGRLVLLEPRGYAKTTRITNLTLMCALEGIQLYTVIVASSISKAQDILEDMRTELTTSEALEKLYPATTACFKHLSRSPQKTRRQTYGGEFTYIHNSLDAIHFPIIPGEESSGVIIQVRPATNLKGLKHKIPSGPRKGQAVRPSLYFFDDPQTEDEGGSPTSVKKIIKNIKRSALKGGTHQKPVDAIMAVTPVEYGDVAWHFVHQEDSFDVVRYKMLESFPTNIDMWYGPYNDIRSDFNREVMGSRPAAYKRARQYVLDNWDDLHEGAEVSWEHAYVPSSPLYEVSAVQHAINIILDDGMEDFEYEYQCNTEYGVYEEEGSLNCPTEAIVKKVSTYPKRVTPLSCDKVVTHIDVNKDILTYLTVASPSRAYRPYIIDFGTWPEQPGKISKRNISVPLRSIYNSADYRETIYLATLDLIQFLATLKYKREDGIQVTNTAIGIDLRFEEVYVGRAVRESPFSNVLIPCWGSFIGPDDDLIHEKRYKDNVRTYENCIEAPNASNTFDVLKIDVNFFKTEVHKALNIERVGANGSMSINQGLDPKVFGDHCNAEYPKRQPGKKSIRTKVQWKEKMSQPDNEFFDNVTACLALLAREGVDLNATPDHAPPPPEKSSKGGGVLENMMNSQATTSLW